MDFDHSPEVRDLRARLLRFMDERIDPNEARREREARIAGAQSPS